MRYPSLGIVLLLAGCSSIFGPDEERAVGIIPGIDTDDPQIEVPATAVAGEEFTITIQTAWHDGCARQGSVEVKSEGATASVTPYDIVTNGGLCTQQAQLFTHTAVLLFTTPGTAEVTIRGRRARNAGVTAIHRSVVVSPIS